MQVVLIMFRNGGERRSFSVVRDLTTIGRREDCDLRVPVGDVSRKHCRLVLSADNLRVQDLGSSNGTFVNGTKVQDAFLNPGDTVSIGPVNFVVQIDGVPGEAELSAPPTPGLGDTGAGGTALALAAMDAAAAEPDAADLGDVAASGDLLQPVPDGAAAITEDDELFPETAPTSDAAVPPPDEPPTISAATDDPFDRVEIDDADAIAEPATAHASADKPAAADDDWDFLIEEPEAAAAEADLNVDLDEPHPH